MTEQWVQLAENVGPFASVKIIPFTVRGHHRMRHRIEIPVSYIKHVLMYQDKEHPVLVVDDVKKRPVRL